MAGPPTKWKPEFLKQAYKLSLLGATDKEMADFFEVVESTFTKWKTDYPELSVTIKKAKSLADGQVVKSLYKRACGYSHKEDKIFLYEGDAVIVPTIKHYPPETLACIYWLNNRQPAKWRNNKDDDSQREAVKMPEIIIKHKKKV